MGQFPNCEIKLCDLEVARVIREDEAIREIIGTPDYVGRYSQQRVSTRLLLAWLASCNQPFLGIPIRIHAHTAWPHNNTMPISFSVH